jgi:Flp pilus assembly protein protease CpaA
MKKLFVLSAMCIVTMLFTNKAMSQVVASGITGACTWELTGTSGNYTLTISGSGAMGDYGQYDNSPWYSYRTGIKTLDLQQGVTTIGNFAFIYCSGLTSVTIPNSVTSIGELAFAWCSGLTSIDVDASNPNYSSVNGVVFNKLQNTLIQYPAGKIGDYTIHNSVTTIRNYAFFDCSGLTSVTIPNSVTTIGESAFYFCIGLTSVTIPNSVTTIGIYAFCACSGLTGSLTIPNSVTTIGHSVFYSCSGLTSVTIPNSVTTIGNSAFYYCSGLTSVTIRTPDVVLFKDLSMSKIRTIIPINKKVVFLQE